MGSLIHISEYVKKYRELLQLERREEMLRHEREMKSLTGKQREKRGRAILNLRGRNTGTGLGGRTLIKFTTGERLPETEISVGDLVMLSRDNPLRPDNPTGTVTEKTGYSLTVAFDSLPPKYLSKERVRMDLYVNDITFQRMLGALHEAENSRGRLTKLMGVLLGYKEPGFAPPKALLYRSKSLNRSQKKAVENASTAKDIYLIHGPPGTGKTVSCVEVIQQAVYRGEKVLATADSNNAVDNILEKLIDAGVGAVRVGHPARVMPRLMEHTLDYLMEQNTLFPELEELRAEAFKLINLKSAYPPPQMKWRRGMSDGKIRDLAGRNAGFRGVSAEKIKEMAKWVSAKERIDTLFRNAERLEVEIIDEILRDAEVVCTTNSTSGSELMRERFFDLLVIDEATQSTEPSCLIPITHAGRVVMAGDHKQLPPTILSREAEEKGLSESLFERMIKVYGEGIYSMLEVQYRMNECIMNFPNQEFYSNRLIADDSAKERRLADLGVKEEESMPVVFIDTSKLDAGERMRKGSTSRENPVEAEIVSGIVCGLMSKGVSGGDIGVISPYNDQIDLLKRQMPEGCRKGLEIKTVDGFQGREKEVIVVSLVRSNPEGELGFLSDLRRLNVSLTRAKRKLILVGDSKTLSSHRTYRRFIKYVNDCGSIFHSIDEFRV